MSFIAFHSCRLALIPLLPSAWESPLSWFLGTYIGWDQCCLLLKRTGSPSFVYVGIWLFSRQVVFQNLPMYCGYFYCLLEKITTLKKILTYIQEFGIILVFPFTFCSHHRMTPHPASTWTFMTVACNLSEVINISSYIPSTDPRTGPFAIDNVSYSKQAASFPKHNVCICPPTPEQWKCLSFPPSPERGDCMPQDLVPFRLVFGSIKPFLVEKLWVRQVSVKHSKVVRTWR